MEDRRSQYRFVVYFGSPLCTRSYRHSKVHSPPPSSTTFGQGEVGRGSWGLSPCLGAEFENSDGPNTQKAAVYCLTAL